MSDTNLTTLDVTTLKIGGTAVTSTAAELNALDGITATVAELNIMDGVTATAAEINNAADASAQNVDGLLALRVARATYDFASDGGAISAIGLGVTIPDNAIVCGGFVDVVTTCTSAADTATIAIHVQGANDIVSAVAINDGGNPWDAGLHAIVPKANTPESTGIKLTAAREITATIAVQAVTAGKFHVFLYYLVGD